MAVAATFNTETFETFIRGCLADDPAHDLAHVKRVVQNAERIARYEGARLEIVLPAAWLHDCVSLPKNHPDAARSSTLAAQKAMIFLQSIGYPEETWSGIFHAIAAHSFSANIQTETLEAQVVQDADRLDALGAIGLARLFIVGGKVNTQIYHPGDPFGEDRQGYLDDKKYMIDHFETKIRKIPMQMKTLYGQQEALQRFALVEQFLKELKRELIDPPDLLMQD